MRIGVDIMGGDFAPEVTVQGALLAKKAMPGDVRLVLLGPRQLILETLEKNQASADGFDIVDCPSIIGMGEHPSKAFQQKPDSSIAVGMKMLAMKEIDGFASAGNTGAVLVGTMMAIKSVPGVIRPCITAALPRTDGSYGILMDVGINPDCRPDVLSQYAILGKLYSRFVFGVDNPRVGLLNIGSEEEKGNLLAKASFELMKESNDYNFVGNIEGYEMFSHKKADVIVCDGFVGNVALKMSEGFYNLIRERGINDEYFNKFNFEHYGGTPVLGVNGVVIIGHGASSAKAIQSMIMNTGQVIKSGLIDRIKEAFN